MLPSKELLSAVLKRKVKEEIGKVFINDCTLTFTYEVGDLRSDINIYELMHMMKEWAKNKGYVVGVDLDRVNIWSIKERLVVNHFEVYFEDYDEFTIKACEWILDQQNVSK